MARRLAVALVDVAKLRARLKVFGRDPERPGQRSERLHRRAPGSGLDPRDVGVRDAGACELALRQPTLQAKAPESDPDRLWLAPSHLNRPIMTVFADGVNRQRLDNKRTPDSVSVASPRPRHPTEGRCSPMRRFLTWRPIVAMLMIAAVCGDGPWPPQ